MRIKCGRAQTGFDPVQCALGVQCGQAFRLTHSTVAVLVYRNCSKVANLKWSKLRIVYLLLLSFLQPAYMISVAFKIATDNQEILWRWSI